MHLENPLLFAILSVVIAIAFIAAFLKSRSEHKRFELKEAADKLRLRFGGNYAEGKLDGLAIRLRLEHGFSESLNICVVCGDEVPFSLSLRSESRLERLEKGMGGIGDTTVGDDVFDNVIRVSCPRNVALATLDASTRELLCRELVEHSLVVERREVRTTLSKKQADVASIVDVARAATRVANKLGGGRHGEEIRLFDRAMKDPLPQVKRLATLELLGRHANTRWAAKLGAALRGHDDPELRVLGANAAGDRDELEAIVLDESVDGAWRAVALDALRESAPGHALKLANDVGPASQFAFNEFLVGYAQSLPEEEERLRLLAKLVSGKDVEVAKLVVSALRTGRSSASNPIHRVLLGVPDEQVRRAAALHLGDYGRIDDVLLISEVLEAGRLNSETKNTLQAAIHGIQRRFGTPEIAGGLTIADDHEVGALSVDDS